MSRSVDLFLSSEEPLETVAATIREVAGVSVDAAADGGWTVRDGDAVASLSGHGYVDDGDLFLSRYPYVLSGRVPATVKPQDTPVAALLRRVGSALQQKTPLTVLLVLDLQYREPVPAAGSPGGPGGAKR